MLLNILRIVTFEKHIFYHASTAVSVIYILLLPCTYAIFLFFMEIYIFSDAIKD